LDTFNPPPGSDLQFIMNELRMLDNVHAIQEALDEMQPSQFTALAIAQENDLLSVSGALFHRLDLITPCCHTPGEKGLHLWATHLGAYTTQHSQQGEPGFTTQTPGLFIGLDTSLGNFYIGCGLGYTYTALQWKHHRGSAKIQSIDAALYGKWHTC